jgi:Domain of unknown function (DUF3883)
MPTYLTNWNPDKWNWESNEEDSDLTRTGHAVEIRWSMGGTKAITYGDRVFLGRQGRENESRHEFRGVIASGVAVSDYSEDRHWGQEGSTTYNVIEFDTILTPQLVLPRFRLSDGPLAEINWGTQRGGIRIDDSAAAVLEQRWAEYLEEIGFGSVPTRLNKFPDFRPYQPDPRIRAAVEDAAVQETIRHFTALGFTIRDRQSENVGWDLEAVKSSEVILLEVKGLSGPSINIELTPNEYFHMKGRSQSYAICVVVNALAVRPSLSVFRLAHETGDWRDEKGRPLSVTEYIGARLSLG